MDTIRKGIDIAKNDTPKPMVAKHDPASPVATIPNLCISIPWTKPEYRTIERSASVLLSTNYNWNNVCIATQRDIVNLSGARKPFRVSWSQWQEGRLMLSSRDMCLVIHTCLMHCSTDLFLLTSLSIDICLISVSLLTCFENINCLYLACVGYPIPLIVFKYLLRFLYFSRIDGL